MKKSRLAERYRVTRPDSFRLKSVDPDDCAGLQSEEKAHARLVEGVERISELQARLYAEHKWSLLLVIQAMDAAGKDSLIKHVMTGINPQGTVVEAFKQPSTEELNHDFLWRCQVKLPSNGHIGIFNRSYYEEVLIVRVHEEILRGQRLPEEAFDDGGIWKGRYRSIVDFEDHLFRNGTRVLKFFLHVSKEEQRARFLSRLDDADKRWKFSAFDLRERERWDEYMRAYAHCLAATTTARSPWFIVPADDKPNARLIVSQAIVEALDDLDMRFPELDQAAQRELRALRKRLVTPEAAPRRRRRRG